MRILIVDDDCAYCTLSHDLLALAGVECVEARDASEARAALAEASFDAVLLDVELPGDDGFEVALDLRSRGVDVPILFVTVREEVEDRVRGLRLGADDYLSKPFDVGELLARIDAISRRGRRARTVGHGGIEIDVELRRATVDGRVVDLSPRELEVLLVLTRAAGATVTKERLLEEVWSYSKHPGTNVLQVTIAQLRRKLRARGRDPVLTDRGRGYRVASGVSVG